MGTIQKTHISLIHALLVCDIGQATRPPCLSFLICKMGLMSYTPFQMGWVKGNMSLSRSVSRTPLIFGFGFMQMISKPGIMAQEWDGGEGQGRMGEEGQNPHYQVLGSGWKAQVKNWGRQELGIMDREKWASDNLWAAHLGFPRGYPLVWESQAPLKLWNRKDVCSWDLNMMLNMRIHFTLSTSRDI